MQKAYYQPDSEHRSARKHPKNWRLAKKAKRLNGAASQRANRKSAQARHTKRARIHGAKPKDRR